MVTQIPLLEVKKAVLQLGKKSFGFFNMNVKRGERIAILGPSGAGKSTLLKLISRELPSPHNEIYFEGQRLDQWRLVDLSFRRAVLPQSGDVAFGLLVSLVIRLGRVARISDPQIEQITLAAAKLAKAEHLLEQRFDTLSGGERGRVHLARIFAQLWDVENGLILVDEPLAALDPGLQFELLDCIEHFASARGHAVVAVLHDINQALSSFKRLWLVDEGQLIEDVASDISALPLLESLYGIRLKPITNDQGDLAVIPMRTRATS